LLLMFASRLDMIHPLLGLVSPLTWISYLTSTTRFSLSGSSPHATVNSAKTVMDL
jgi:hypothetical protein